MTVVRITRLETLKRGVNATLFDPFTDPISLRLTVTVSTNTPQPILRSLFQIIAFRDNYVKFHQNKDIEISPSGEQEYYIWVDQGSARDLRLDWTQSQLFGFRGAAQLFTRINGSEKAIEGFDVSGTKWFRFEPLFGL